MQLRNSLPTRPTDVDDATNAPTWERLAPTCGVTFVLVDLVVAVLSGKPPATGAAPASITEYYVEHAQGVQAGLWLFGLGVIALTFWSAGLWRWMVRVEHGNPGLAVASLLGLSIAGALALASTAVWSNLALHSGAVEDVATWHALGAILSAAAGVGIAAHLLATNLVGIGQQALPMWVTGIGFLSAAGWITQAVAATTSNDAASSSIGLSAFLLWCVWILGISHRLRTDRVPPR